MRELYSNSTSNMFLLATFFALSIYLVMFQLIRTFSVPFAYARGIFRCRASDVTF